MGANAHTLKKQFMNAAYSAAVLIVASFVFLTTGCGVSQSITPFTPKGASSSSSTSSSSTGWSGATAIDVSNMGISNMVYETAGNNAPYCANSVQGAGYSSSGCVQPTSALFANSRWFVGFPQKLIAGAAGAFGATYDFFNILGSVSTTSFSFGSFGSGLSFLNTIGAPYQVARYVQYAKLSSGKVIGVFWIYNSTAGGSHVYTNIYDPNTNTWGSMTLLSLNPYDESSSLDITYEEYAYNGVNFTGGMAGNHCRPKIAATGNSAMVVWCENWLGGVGTQYGGAVAGSTDRPSYLRYARYVEGSGWQTNSNSERSSPLLQYAGTTSNGMNIANNANNGYPKQSFRPGMARRITVPAYVPNSLFVGGGTTNTTIQRLNGTSGVQGVATVAASIHSLALPAANAPNGSAGRDFTNYPATVSALHVDGSNIFAGNTTNVTILYASDYTNGVDITGVTTEVTISGFLQNVTSITSCNGILFVAAGTDKIYIWNSVPVSDTTIASADFRIDTGGARSFNSIYCDGSRFFAADITNAELLIWHRVPSTDLANAADTINPSVGGADVKITGFGAGNLYVFSDSKRMYVSDTAGNKVYVWNAIPKRYNTTITPQPIALAGNASSGGASFSLSSTATLANLSSPKEITGNGQSIYVYDSGHTQIAIWNDGPWMDRAPDQYVTGVTTGGSLAWGRDVSTSWPIDSSYSVNPIAGSDTLKFYFRGSTFSIDNIPGDSNYYNRCTAISNVVNYLNSDTTFTNYGLKASLPSAWGGPTCSDDDRGNAQFFYITYNHEFNQNLGVDFDSGNEMTASTAGFATCNDLVTALKKEDFLILTSKNNNAGTSDDRFFNLGDQNDCSIGAGPTYYGYIGSSIHPSVTPVANIVPLVRRAHYFVGRMSDDATTVGYNVNGQGILPPNGNPTNPITTTATSYLQDADLSPATFTDVAALGNGTFSVIQSARNIVLGFRKFMKNYNSSTPIYASDLVPSVLAFPRVLYGYVFSAGDWTRRHTGSTAAPQPFFIGPVEPFARQYSTGEVEPFPLGVRFPKFISSGNGKGLVLFYARRGTEPYGSISSSTYDGGSLDSSELDTANALWMSEYDTQTGFSTATAISPNTSSDKVSSSSFNTDLDVCETSDPFAGAASTSIGTISCIVGMDPYSSTPTSVGTTTVTDNFGYTHDVAPIPAAMNSSGYAVVGFHRKDTCSSNQGIGFYVAKYGPRTGISSFTRIDSGSGRSCTAATQSFTMGGNLAIDDSGNIAAVWEERSINSTRSQAENHIYFRYYSASSASWGTVTQIDSSSITSYGNTSFTYAPEAPMMPSVTFSGTGRILVTWSGPACNTTTSNSCRRRIMSNQYR